MDKFEKENLSIRLSADDKENLNAVIIEKGIPYSLNWSGLQVFRAILDAAVDNAKPRIQDTPETIKKIQELEAEKKRWEEVNAEQLAQIEKLFLDKQMSEAQAVPKEAIVLKFGPQDKQKIIDVYDVLKLQNIVENYEQFFAGLLATLQRANMYVLDATDYELLKKYRKDAN